MALPRFFCTALTFLLTPLREGRLFPSFLSISSRCISTHAPAGGATDDFIQHL